MTVHPPSTLKPAPAANEPRLAESDAGKVARDERGATTLEWTLLVCVIALPGYFILMSALNLLVEHYRMMTTLNGLPFP